MRKLLIPLLVASCFFLLQCSRKCDGVPPPFTGYRLTYGDSVFYLKSVDYVIRPAIKAKGTYSVFPNNLAINRATGEITVTGKGSDGESQTGTWYKITFRSTGGDRVDSCFLLLSGISYLDRFYFLNQHDSIIRPVYNGNPLLPLPAGNYGLTSDTKFAVNAANGEININECKRRGFFSGSQAGSSWKIATVKYAIHDESSGVDNRLDLVIYYYKTISDVPANVGAIMQAHQQMTLGIRDLPFVPATTGPPDNNLPGSLSLAKPRPPCVIIVGN